MRKLFLILILSFLTLWADGRDIKVLYWNIQNGMSSDQGNNYDNFVDYMNGISPDICVWCKAELRYRTDSCGWTAAMSPKSPLRKRDIRFPYTGAS